MEFFAVRHVSLEFGVSMLEELYKGRIKSLATCVNDIVIMANLLILTLALLSFYTVL